MNLLLSPKLNLRAVKNRRKIIALMSRIRETAEPF